LTYVAGYTKVVYPETVTHPSINRARRRVTTLMNMDLHQPFDTHCCHTKNPMPDRVKPSFVISGIRALWRSGLSVKVPGCQKLQMAA